MTPVHLTTCRQDYRSALPVLLIRRARVLGGELRVPLDPCVHPVRLLPVTRKMASKFELALAYGWHSKQVRLRASDVATYHQWTSRVRAALESGRRPLVACSPAGPPQVIEGSNLALTASSCNNSASRSSGGVHPEVPREEEAGACKSRDRNILFDRKYRSKFFCAHYPAMTDPSGARLCAKEDWSFTLTAGDSCRAIGSFRCNPRERDGSVNGPDGCAGSLRRDPASFVEPSTEISWIYELYLRTFSGAHLTQLSILTGGA